MLAVRFTPGNSEALKLLGARFYIEGELHSFDVFLFDSYKVFMSPGPKGSQAVSYVYRWTVTPVSIGWVYLNMSSDPENPIYVSDDFYIAIAFTIDQNPRLGVDTIGPRSNRGWFVDNQTEIGWIPYSTYAEQNRLTDGNLMIRAVVGPLYENTTPTATTTATATAAASAWGFIATGLGVLAVAAVGVRHVRKNRQIR
jgi:hypothetical protein